MRGKLLAKKKEIKTWGPDDIEAKRDYLGLEGSPTRVVKISKPKVSRGGEILMPKNESELDKAVDGLIEYLQKKEII
ncbi:MAG: electron transfer flavoprotein subunit beta, partial [Candidatus Marinimicrobia bacterium]|nr:electron transfer flavoprotein subunit beta [Candidatus Neomarinimicrobiota bacterium]